MSGDKLPEIEVDHDAMREAVVTELSELERANQFMYSELKRWHDEGYSVLLLERDGDNLKLKPVY